MEHLRSRLVNVTALCLTAAMLAMLVYWIATRSLENISTAFEAAVLTMILGGILLLNRRGRTRPAAALLTGILFLLALAVSAVYGLGTPSIAGFVLPILLAAFALGPASCYAVTGAAILAVWGVGAASALGWYEPRIPVQPSDLTFTAPMYTLLFALVAVICGMAGRSIQTER